MDNLIKNWSNEKRARKIPGDVHHPKAPSNFRRRHRRGTKERYTVPIYSSDILSSDKKYDPMIPLYVHTDSIFYSIDQNRKTLSHDQLEDFDATLEPKEGTSPKSSSSGFGSDASSKENSPKSSRDQQIDFSDGSRKINYLCFLILLCVQYLISYLLQLSRSKSRGKSEIDSQIASEQLDLKDRSDDQNELRKPFYAEIHLGRENQRLTTLAAVESDRLGYEPKLISVASETKYATVAFEVHQRGLGHIAKSIHEEMQNWYDDQNEVIICFEMQWSTPDRYRDIPCEVQLKNDLFKCVRLNNRRVLDVVERRNNSKPDRLIIFPDSITEEVFGRQRNAKECVGGCYRRYYAGLLPLRHNETENDHIWKFDQHIAPESINWPTIAPLQKITIVILNLISLKLDQL